MQMDFTSPKFFHAKLPIVHICQAFLSPKYFTIWLPFKLWTSLALTQQKVKNNTGILSDHDDMRINSEQ